MICKGNTHKNGARLARYITTAKEGEHVQLYELRGFASNDIHDAFRSVHVMADATKCEQPFFHLQVRNPATDRHLTPEEWERVADRIESKLGLSGQPRAITFHTYKHNGDRHMHVVWSRIDAETLTARPLPFFKERLKEVSRELEKELGLTRVRSERDGLVQAPSRDEFEQARRLGVDIREVREAIRECWERSDCGRSFQNALTYEGLGLAKGDRRDFVVVDHEGGLHGLNKRILGISAAQIRERLGDLDRDNLPSIQQMREKLEQSRDKTPLWDRDRANQDWQDAVSKAAIDREKIERQFVEPKSKKDTMGGREKEGRVWETANSTADKFKEAGLEMTGSTGSEKPLKGIEKWLWDAYRSGPEARDFAAALDRHGLAFARVTPDEADQSYREAQFAKAVGRRAPIYRDGEVVVVQSPGPEYLRQGEWTPLNRVQKLDQPHAERYLENLGLDKSKLKDIRTTKTILETGAQERATYWAAIRLENAQGTTRLAPKTVTNRAAALGKTAERALGKTLDRVGNALEAVLAPVLTPEQKRAGALTQAKRSRDASDQADINDYLAELAAQRRRLEEERTANARRERDDRER